VQHRVSTLKIAQIGMLRRHYKTLHIEGYFF